MKNSNPFKVGDKASVVKRGLATFVVPKVKRGNKLVDAPGPCYPHGEEVTITSIKDCDCYVQTSDGKVWEYPMGFWCLDFS